MNQCSSEAEFNSRLDSQSLSGEKVVFNLSVPLIKDETWGKMEPGCQVPTDTSPIGTSANTEQVHPQAVSLWVSDPPHVM